MERTFSIMRRTTLVRTGIGLAIAAVAVLGFAVPASAHVTVNPSTATQGGYIKVAFRVPNEKDTANTVKVEVIMPESNPIASVSLRPVAGWTAVAERTKLPTPIKSDDGEITEAITKVTWTAEPAAVVKPGQFQEFEVSLGPLPKVDQLVFKALQYYSDGEIVRWIEEPAAGGDEPEHPAPVLKLAAADGTPAAGTANAGTSGSVSDPSAGSDSSSGDGVAIGLGIGGLVAGLAGLAVGFLAFRRASTRAR
jgi:periplasmic copper chaperone A